MTEEGLGENITRESLQAKGSDPGDRRRLTRVRVLHRSHLTLGDRIVARFVEQKQFLLMSIHRLVDHSNDPAFAPPNVVIAPDAFEPGLDQFVKVRRRLRSWTEEYDPGSWDA